MDLKEKVERWTATSHGATPVPGLSLYREPSPGDPHRYTREAALCLIVQGSKRVIVGSEVYTYDEDHYLLVTVDLPVVAQILEASPDRPYLSLTLKLDQRLIAELMVNQDLPPLRPSHRGRSILVSPLTQALREPVERLLDLFEEPPSIPILSPLIQKEITYRLLMGDMGPDLRLLASAGSPSSHIGRAVEWLKKNYNQSFHVEDLAASSQMSTTAFHHHFRQLTSMSPVQYQKWLRLQEARRLMLADHFDAARAAYQVGYESPSQFSREYRRLFDAPPSQDVKSLRGAS